MPGIFISEGMRLRITDFTLRIGKDGSVDSSMQWQVALDVWPMWLDVAIDHAVRAVEARSELAKELRVADGEIEGDLQARLMSEEAKAGMVAIAAAAFALDNFADVIREFAPDIEATKAEWRKAGTARHKQISETIRRTFKISNKGARTLKPIVGEVFRFRDWAVHPSGRFRQPLQHDLIDVGVEWRFVAFRADNAVNAVRAAISILSQCISSPRLDNEKLVEWCNAAKPRVDPRQERAETLLRNPGSD